MSRHRITFIINPNSGIGKYKAVENGIEKFLDKDLFEPIIEYLGTNDKIENIANIAIEKGSKIIAAVGGDGSVNAVANAIIGTDVAVAIIPVGSGNGLANFLKIPKQINEAINIINSYHIEKIDTILINNKRVVSIAGLGYDALIAKKMKASPIRGFAAYLHIAVHEFIKYRPKKYCIQCNDQYIETKALFVAFANSNQFGYNLPIISNASLTDGLLHLCIVEKPPIPLVSWVGFNLFFHRKENATRYIKIIPTSEVFVRSNKSREINLDGESIKMPKKIHVRIDPKSLNILVP